VPSCDTGRCAREPPPTRHHHLEDDVNAALKLAGETHEVVNELPVDPVVIGIAGFGGLVALLLVAYAFRSVGHRH
jgi:hypothetical protein